MTTARVAVRVEGTVQGVGFRPFVYRLAHEEGLAGHVFNDERGVAVEVEGDAAAVERFLARLPAQAPPLARIDRVRTRSLPPAGEHGFRILDSRRTGERGGRDRARHRDLRRLPGRAARPRRPALRLPVHQLHELRPAVHDRPRRAL